jgi:hypothetical protein
MSGTPGFSPAPPGFSAERTSYEAGIFFQTAFVGDVLYAPNPLIDSTAEDTGHTNYTSVLRPGLVMAELDSGAGWVDYDNDATDGSQEARGILMEECNLIDYTTGSAADRQKLIAISGKVRASMLILLDQQARTQLATRGFVFDDAPGQIGTSFLRVVEKAANYTVLATDHGTRFLATTGAVNFTLPTKAIGLTFEFYNTVDAAMAILSAGSADDIIAAGDAAADSVTFSTMSLKIGSHARVTCVAVGGSLKWMLSNLGGTTATVA